MRALESCLVLLTFSSESRSIKPAPLALENTLTSFLLHLTSFRLLRTTIHILLYIPCPRRWSSLHSGPFTSPSGPLYIPLTLAFLTLAVTLFNSLHFTIPISFSSFVPFLSTLVVALFNFLPYHLSTLSVRSSDAALRIVDGRAACGATIQQSQRSGRGASGADGGGSRDELGPRRREPPGASRKRDSRRREQSAAGGERETPAGYVFAFIQFFASRSSWKSSLRMVYRTGHGCPMPRL